MSLLPEKYRYGRHGSILSLEKEIVLLEQELQAVGEQINSFESSIRLSLRPQILRLRELNSLYKTLKAAKKAKRLAQKKRGKNYREPKGLIRTIPKAAGPMVLAYDQQKLKKTV